MTTILSHRLSHSSPTSVLHKITVSGAHHCPNLHCSVYYPHTFEYPLPKPCPSGISELHLQRFTTENNPFPRTNRWEIATRPLFLLSHGCRIYSRLYGTLTLVDTYGAGSSKWRVFRCADEDGAVVAEIVAREEWCVPRGETPSITRSFLTSIVSLIC